MTDILPNFDYEAWNAAQRVWRKADEVVPEVPDQSSLHYLNDLELIVANFKTAKSISEHDRNNDLSFEDLANRCRHLSDTLSNIDDVALARLAGVSTKPIDQMLSDTITNLIELNATFRSTKSPRIPRKKKHENDDFLVVLLANLYEQTTNRNASVTTDPITNERKGTFVDFIKCFAERFLPDESLDLDGRAIQRALKTRRENPDPLG